MIEKIKPGCPSTTLPCDFGDSVTFMEQEAKNTLKLQETDEALEKLKETVDTLDKECVKKIAPNTVTGASIYASLDNTNNPELHEDKNAELVADSITDKNGVFPPTVEFGDVVRRTPSGVVWGATADVDPEGVEHEQPLAYVNVETLKKKMLALENMLNAAISRKANVIPKPSTGSLLYGIAASSSGEQPIGFSASTYRTVRYEVVQRDVNGQIILPDQIAYEPGNKQAISREYADKHYKGGANKQRILHYFVRIAGYGAGATYEGDVPLPIRSNDDAVYYTVTDSCPSVNYGDINPWATHIRIGDGSVAEASWSTNGVIIKHIGGQDYAPGLTGTTEPLNVYMAPSAETTHAFNTKSEYDAYVSGLQEQGFTNVEDQVGYWIEFI